MRDTSTAIEDLRKRMRLKEHPRHVACDRFRRRGERCSVPIGEIEIGAHQHDPSVEPCIGKKRHGMRRVRGERRCLRIGTSTVADRERLALRPLCSEDIRDHGDESGARLPASGITQLHGPHRAVDGIRHDGRHAPRNPCQVGRHEGRLTLAEPIRPVGPGDHHGDGQPRDGFAQLRILVGLRRLIQQ